MELLRTFLFASLCFSVTFAEIAVLKSTHKIYDRSSKFKIMGSGFTADEADIELDICANGHAALEKGEDFTLSKTDETELVLTLLPNKKWANVDGHAPPIAMILSGVFFPAEDAEGRITSTSVSSSSSHHVRKRRLVVASKTTTISMQAEDDDAAEGPANLLIEPVIVAFVLATPTIEVPDPLPELEAPDGTRTPELRIKGTGFMGIRFAALYFKGSPALKNGEQYDDVTKYPLTDDNQVIVLRLRAGAKWSTEPGPLVVLGIDTGAGALKMTAPGHGTDGVPVANVVASPASPAELPAEEEKSTMDTEDSAAAPSSSLSPPNGTPASSAEGEGGKVGSDGEEEDGLPVIYAKSLRVSIVNAALGERLAKVRAGFGIAKLEVDALLPSSTDSAGKGGAEGSGEGTALIPLTMGEDFVLEKATYPAASAGAAAEGGEGLVLKLLNGKSWAEFGSISQPPVLTLSGLYVANADRTVISTNLLKELGGSIPFARVLHLPHVALPLSANTGAGSAEEVPVLVANVTSYLRIPCAGVFGSKKVKVYFGPGSGISEGVTYDDVTAYPIRTVEGETITLKLRAGQAWGTRAGPLTVQGLDSGGGPVRVSGGADGAPAVVAQIVEYSLAAVLKYGGAGDSAADTDKVPPTDPTSTGTDTTVSGDSTGGGEGGEGGEAPSRHAFQYSLIYDKSLKLRLANDALDTLFGPQGSHAHTSIERITLQPSYSANRMVSAFTGSDGVAHSLSPLESGTDFLVAKSSYPPISEGEEEGFVLHLGSSKRWTDFSNAGPPVSLFVTELVVRGEEQAGEDEGMVSDNILASSSSSLGPVLVAKVLAVPEVVAPAGDATAGPGTAGSLPVVYSSGTQGTDLHVRLSHAEGTCRSHIYFRPMSDGSVIKAGETYDDVTVYPLSREEQTLTLRLRPGRAWSTQPGPITILGVDTGGGALKAGGAGSNGVVVAHVVMTPAASIRM